MFVQLDSNQTSFSTDAKPQVKFLHFALQLEGQRVVIFILGISLEKSNKHYHIENRKACLLCCFVKSSQPIRVWYNGTSTTVQPAGCTHTLLVQNCCSFAVLIETVESLQQLCNLAMSHVTCSM